jgi:hypothetical protein
MKNRESQTDRALISCQDTDDPANGLANGLANKVSPALPRESFDVSVALRIVALHQLRDPVQIKHPGVNNDIATCASIITNNDSVMLAQSAFYIVKRALTAICRVAEDFWIISVNHVQRQEYQILPVRAFRRHGL